MKTITLIVSMMKEVTFMYINSTNLFLDIIKYNTKVPASWITSEKYENCENFYQNITTKPNRMKFFHKKK